MAHDSTQASDPDLAKGIDEGTLKDGEMVAGHVGDERVLLARRGPAVFAVGAKCTHYGGPLDQGILVGETVRCPWHHACFDLKTGEPTAPALSPIPCWNVERDGHRLRVTTRTTAPAASLPTRQTPARGPSTGGPRAIVIVGGGAAGHAAAEMLRRRGFDGRLTMLSADRDAPYDRPNLSKDYLAGTAPEEWIPLRAPELYRDQEIELVLGARVSSLDLASKRVVLEGSASRSFDALLLATGAEPVRLRIPGGDLPHVHTLRTLADSRGILAKLPSTRRALVVGAGFIGLEVAASLRARGIAVDVVAPEAHPLEHAVGAELGRFVKTIHEEHGVVFHLGQTVQRIDPEAVLLGNGTLLKADLVVAGIGVRPRVDLAEGAGIAVDDGIVVDPYLATSAPGVFAAGDVASWPDPRADHRIRVEHWVVAGRHGQIAARNMLGERVACRFAPFFWSQHYDACISEVGYAKRWDRTEVRGSIERRDCCVVFRSGDRVVAIATLGRDQQSLRAELALEEGDDNALASMAE